MCNLRWYKVPVYLVVFLALMAGFSFITMALWNMLIPGLFNGPVITFWQTVGLLILAKIFFTTLHRPYYRHYHKWHPRSRFWKMRMEERMAAMSPEQREKFREEWKQRCRDSHHDHWNHHRKEESSE